MLSFCNKDEDSVKINFDSAFSLYWCVYVFMCIITETGFLISELVMYFRYMPAQVVRTKTFTFIIKINTFDFFQK